MLSHSWHVSSDPFAPKVASEPFGFTCLSLFHLQHYQARHVTLLPSLKWAPFVLLKETSSSSLELFKNNKRQCCKSLCRNRDEDGTGMEHSAAVQNSKAARLRWAHSYLHESNSMISEKLYSQGHNHGCSFVASHEQRNYQVDVMLICHVLS